MNNKIIIGTTIIILILGGLLIYQKTSFPVKYKICNVSYEDCSVEAKFKDIDSCESVRERQAWYCNSTDKQNIACEEKDSIMSASYCSR